MTDNKEKLKTLSRIQGAYLNFKAFLASSDTLIDYQYCWDLVCRPNPLLFPGGITLVIFEIPFDDISDKINIVCPSTKYKYNPAAPYCLILKQKQIYQLPSLHLVCLYTTSLNCFRFDIFNYTICIICLLLFFFLR